MLAQQLLQKRDFSLLRGFKELLFDCRQRIDAINFDGERVFLHTATDRRDGFRPLQRTTMSDGLPVRSGSLHQ